MSVFPKTKKKTATQDKNFSHFFLLTNCNSRNSRGVATQEYNQEMLFIRAIFIPPKVYNLLLTSTLKKEKLATDHTHRFPFNLISISLSSFLSTNPERYFLSARKKLQ